jgi:ribosomal protein S6--L-glutamate ligase
LSEFDVVLVRTMPAGTLEQVVFRMDALGRLEAAGCVVINPPRAIESAVDKYLASAKLHEAGLPTPRTLVCQTIDAALDGFERLGGDVVVKPLFGGEGRGMTRVCDQALAERAFRLLTQLGAVIYLQEFIPHEGYDLRLLVLGDRVLTARRSNPNDWRTNVSRGATMAPADPPPHLADMARRAADALGAPLAGVDLLPARDGQVYVLEVNAVPGWRALAKTLDIDVAALVLEYASASYHVRP